MVDVEIPAVVHKADVRVTVITVLPHPILRGELAEPRILGRDVIAGIVFYLNGGMFLTAPARMGTYPGSWGASKSL